MSSAYAARAPEQSTLDQLERDEEGFLLDAQDWHPGLIDARYDRSSPTGP